MGAHTQKSPLGLRASPLLPDLTAIIGCKDRPKQIKFCIQSIFSCSQYPRVILVDYGSATPLKFHDFEHVSVVRVTGSTKIFHKARALNIGIQKVTTPYLVITDAEQLFAPNFFIALQRTLEEDPIAFVMCKTYFLRSWPDKHLLNAGKKGYKDILRKAKNSGIQLQGDGCCNGTSTAWAIKVRGYDEAYVGYGGEDSDFALRASLAGRHKIWIHGHTSMVHLPHAQDGKYYAPAVRARNKSRYDSKVKSKAIFANVGRSWGLCDA